MRWLLILESFVNRFNQKVILYYSMHYRLSYGFVISALFVFKIGCSVHKVSYSNCVLFISVYHQDFTDAFDSSF